MKSQGLIDQYDDVGAAGAAKNIVDPMQPGDDKFVLRQLNLAKQLHDVQEVVIVNHRDCGAYGKGAFATEEAETERHSHDLLAAATTVMAEVPGVTVRTYLAKLVAPGKVDFQEITA